MSRNQPEWQPFTVCLSNIKAATTPYSILIDCECTELKPESSGAEAGTEVKL